MWEKNIYIFAQNSKVFALLAYPHFSSVLLKKYLRIEIHVEESLSPESELSELASGSEIWDRSFETKNPPQIPRRAVLEQFRLFFVEKRGERHGSGRRREGKGRSGVDVGWRSRYQPDLAQLTILDRLVRRDWGGPGSQRLSPSQ